MGEMSNMDSNYCVEHGNLKSSCSKCNNEGQNNAVEPVEEKVNYSDLDEVFDTNKLDDHVFEIEKQMANIRYLLGNLSESKKVFAEDKTDDGQNENVGEDMGKIEEAFRNFTLNGQVIDMISLTPEAGGFRDKYNLLVDEIKNRSTKFDLPHF